MRNPLLPIVAALVSALLAVSSDAASRPNVILIVTDDQGYGDFGATGNEVIETPRIDALAAESTSMTDFYVSPVCSPTRASLMTGRYNYRTRCIDTFLGRSMMEPEEVTVAEVLAGAGYATGIFGKWHLGDCYPMRPQDQGFEEVLVHRGGGLAQPAEPRENQRRYTDPILFANGRQTATEGYCTDVYFDAALEFIDAAQSEQRPFFIYLPTNAPHGPFEDVPPELLESYRERLDQLATLVADPLPAGRREAELDKLARIAAMITNVDQNVGRLVDHLEARGLARDTMLVVMVDNGPNSRRWVGPFRGHKSTVWEGGIRSPLWVRWPGRLKPGHADSTPAAHIDLMPTILEACDVPAPSGLQIDGRSLLPLLEGRETDWPERPLVLQAHRGDMPVRYHNFALRQGRWKLVHPSSFGRESFAGPPQFELYDLVADAGETNDLAADQPERVERLRGAYDAWFDEVSRTRPDNYAPPRIVVGTKHENPTVLTRQDWRGGSWARNSGGHWLLQLPEPGYYDVILDFDPDRQSEMAELRLGEMVQSQRINPGDSVCVFRGIRLPAGPLRLEAMLSSSDERRGVYQVQLIRL